MCVRVCVYVPIWCLQDGTDASAYNLERRFWGTTNPPRVRFQS